MSSGHAFKKSRPRLPPLKLNGIPPLRDACEAAERTLKQKEEAQRCVAAVEKSGEDTDFLDSTILVKKLGQDNRTTIKELVCTAGRNGTQISFRTEGVLMWSKTLMEIQREDVKGKLTIELASAKEAADWQASSWIVGPEVGAHDIALDEFTACLMGTQGCSLLAR